MHSNAYQAVHLNLFPQKIKSSDDELILQN